MPPELAQAQTARGMGNGARKYAVNKKLLVLYMFSSTRAGRGLHKAWCTKRPTRPTTAVERFRPDHVVSNRSVTAYSTSTAGTELLYVGLPPLSSCDLRTVFCRCTYVTVTPITVQSAVKSTQRSYGFHRSAASTQNPLCCIYVCRSW